MAQLTIAYRGPGRDSTELYTATFDGQVWSGGLPIRQQRGGINPRSSHNPAACLFNNRYYLVYKGASTDQLHFAYFDGRDWYGDKVIEHLPPPGGEHPATSTAPGLAVFNGRMFAVYKAAHSDQIQTAEFDGTTWRGDVSIDHQPGGICPRTDDRLHPVVFAGRLFLFYKHRDSDVLRACWFDDHRWAGNVAISQMDGNISPLSTHNPGAAVFNDRLVIVYRGAHSKMLHSATLSPAMRWSGDTPIKDQPGHIDPESVDNPGMQVVGDRLYMAYRDAASDAIRTASVDMENRWAGNDKIHLQPGNLLLNSPYSPDLAFQPVAIDHLPDWLRDIADDTRICDLTLPGTHDSAAINTSIHTPYACHNTTLTQQLQMGIRLLDIRLKVLFRGTDKFDFITCHGNIGAPINTYQSFDSALKECRDFLKDNPSEFIAMSLKIDDWSNMEDRKAAITRALAAFITERISTLSIPHMPTLREVRGRVYLLNRIDHDLHLGTPIEWPDNTAGEYMPPRDGRQFGLYVQDKWKDLETFSPETEKLRLFLAAARARQAGQLLLNFASATSWLLWGVYIMRDLLATLGEVDSKSRLRFMGWALFDYEADPYQTVPYGFLNVVQVLIASNFEYARYDKRFSVE